MSNRFHNKWHRVSHHTYRDPTIIDAGWDPIASHESPFRGDFVIDGSSQPYHGSFFSKDIYTVNLWPGDDQVAWKATTITAHSNLEVTKNITGDQNLYIRQNSYTTGDVYITGNTTISGWGKIDDYVYINGQDTDGYGLVVQKDSHFVGSADIDKNLNVDQFLEVHGNITGDSDFYLKQNANITGNTSGQGWLKIDQYGHFVGDISGDSNFYVTGYGHIGEYVHIYGNDGTADAYGLIVDNNSHFVGSADIDSNLNVDGYTYINGQDTDGWGLKIDKKLNVNGKTVLNDQLDVLGTNNNNISGNIRLKGNLSADDYIRTTDNLDVSGSGHIVQNLQVDGYVHINGTPSDADGYALVVPDLCVTQHLSAVSATFHSIDITASEGRGFIVTGYAPGETIPVDYFEIPTGSFIHGDKNVYLDHVGLYVDGWAVFNGESEFTKDIAISGDLTLGGDLSVSGDATIDETLNVTGATLLSSTLKAGATTLDSLSVTGNAAIGGTLNVTGAMTVSQLTATGDSYFNDGVFIKNVGGYNGDPSAPGIEDVATIINKKTDQIINVTWQQLQTMIADNSGAGSLVPGQQYRITDYKATTVQADTQSANHQFDIIVVADTPNKLNENARAVLHDGDPYFANCKLEAWRLKYCIDNDTTRFAWADSTNGKGVVYWMQDEFNNECPYDFKGITMKAYGDTDNVFRYTFDSGDASGNTDLSLNGGPLGRNVYGNKIEVLNIFGVPQLNRIVFKGEYCSVNTFGNSCRSNTFGSYCSSNTFGYNFQFGKFGQHCFSNTFGDSCSYTILGNYCSSNVFGDSCAYNTFGYRPPDFSTTTSYAVGDSCWRNGSVYRCTVAHTGPWLSSDFVKDPSSVARAYYRYVTFENGVEYVFLDCTAARTDSEYYQNVTVAKGILGTASAPKSIQDANKNQTFKTTYQPANSQVISV